MILDNLNINLSNKIKVSVIIPVYNMEKYLVDCIESVIKQDLNDIIGSDLFKEMKQGFLDNKKIHELCKKCNFYDLRR